MSALSYLLLPAAFLAAIDSVRAETILVPRGASWKYFSAGAVDSRWNQIAFDDSAWPSGQAQLGYGEGDESTMLFDGGGDAPPTIYFRRIFLATNVVQNSSVTLRILAEDGGVVYINGGEVARRNMPMGRIGFTTPALTNVEPNQDTFAQFGIFWYKLTEGTNVIAVEVHQQVGGSLECSFDLELLANIPLQPPTILITNPPNDAVLAPGDIFLHTTSSDSAGRVTRVEFYTNGFLLGQTVAEPFSLIWRQAPAGHYRVVARAYDDFFLSGDSPSVHLQVGVDTLPQLLRGPYLQSGSATNVIVRWRTDWLTDSVAQYGTNLDVIAQALTNAEGTLEHEMNIKSLQPDTVYYYSIGSTSRTLAGGGQFFFRTAPTNAGAVRIWAIGDAGTADANAAAVRDAYYSVSGPRSTDLFLMLGDNAYYAGTDAQYQTAVFNFYPDLLRQTVVWPTIGNHEAADDPGQYGNYAVDYLNIFSLPMAGEAGGVASGTEHYYSFDYANIHFVCLDSFLSDRSLHSPMLTWLETDLAGTDKDWIIAFWHHPPYSWGSHNSDDEPELIEMRQGALPILEKYGVDLVLSGHSHNYERSYLLDGHYGNSWELEPGMVLNSAFGGLDGAPYRKPAGGLGAHRGTVYVVCGCSGQGGFPEEFPRHPAMALNHGGYGSMVIQVDGLQLRAQFLRPSLEVDDDFTIDKTLPSAIPPPLKINRSPSGATLSWPTSIPPFTLETAGDLTSAWTPSTTPAAILGRQNVVPVQFPGTNHLFRLRSAPPEP